MEGGMETGRDGETAVERERQREGKRQKGSWEWVLGFGVAAAFGWMLVGRADFGGPGHLGHIYTHTHTHTHTQVSA